MKKGYVILIIIIFTILSYIGIKIYKDKNKEDKKAFEYTKIQETISEEEKVGPNSRLVLKTYYTKCSHTKTEQQDIPKELINLTKNELQLQYKQWKIERFSKDEIILKKNLEEYCEEHYVLRNKDGYINVYSIDENGNEKKYLSTEISTLYLPETDQINLEKGIYIYGKEKLIEILQDFE